MRIALLISLLSIVLVGCECGQLNYHAVEPENLSVRFYTDCELTSTENAHSTPEQFSGYRNLGTTVLHTYSCDEATFTVPLQQRNDETYVASENWAGCSRTPAVQDPEQFANAYGQALVSRAVFSLAAEDETFCATWYSLFENETFRTNLDPSSIRLTDECLQNSITQNTLDDWRSRCELPSYEDTRCIDFVESSQP